MIDLHCHYLPCVDDGAQSLEEAIALARAAVANGIRAAVLTPHVHPGRYDNTLSSLKPSFDAFRESLRSHAVRLDVRLGGEVRLLPESLELLCKGDLPTIGWWQGQRVVLLEFPHGHIPVGSLSAVGYMRQRDIVPLIAHPERNRDVMQDWRKLAPFVQQGCLLQLTAASVLGLFGVSAQQTAERLLTAGWVTALATDAHNLNNRPPLLAEGRAAIAQRYGDKAAVLLTEANPGVIIGNNTTIGAHYGSGFQSMRVVDRQSIRRSS